MEESLSARPGGVQAASLAKVRSLGALAAEHDLPAFKELPSEPQSSCAPLMHNGADHEAVRQEPDLQSVNEVEVLEAALTARTTVEGRAIMDIHNLLQHHGTKGTDLFSAKAVGLAEVYRRLMYTNESESSIQKELGLSPSAYAQRKKLVIKALVQAKPSLLTVPVLAEQEASPQVIKPREKWAPGERLKVLRLLRVVADERGVAIGRLMRDDVYKRFLSVTDPSLNEEEVYEMFGGDRPTTTLARNLLNLLDQRLDPKDISIPELRRGTVGSPDSPEIVNEKILEVRDRLLDCGSDWQEMLELSQELSRLLAHALASQPTTTAAATAREAEPHPANNTGSKPSAVEELLTIASQQHPNDLHQQLHLIAERMDVGVQSLRLMLAGKTRPPADRYLPHLFAHFNISPEKQKHIRRLYEEEREQTNPDKRKRPSIR